MTMLILSKVAGRHQSALKNRGRSMLSYFSSGPSYGDRQKKNRSNILQSEHADASTRGLGQVIFLNSVDSGRIILLSLALGDPTLAGCAALGAVTSTSTSHAIGLDKKAYDDGLWGYNGALVGCAAATFASSSIPIMVTSTMIGAAATPVLSASLKSAIPNVPQWTWSFNFITLTSLLRTKPLLENSNGEEAATISTGFGDLFMSPLVGISQIFVVGSPLTGAGIVAATYNYSPKLAMHAVGGSTIGCLVGLISGVDLSDVCLGLWGYNSALTSMAVGVFFVHSRESVALSVSSAAASAFLFGAMQTVVGAFGVPCLTLPFCSVASACYLLEGHVPGLKLATDPHSPEKNV